MKAILPLTFVPGFLVAMTASAREIRVVVALADNATQGIIPVPPKIGNGDDRENNLYWGCCLSEKYFGPHLQRIGAKPVVTTQQLMYPGGFVLKAALDGWLRGESTSAALGRVDASYAANQKISVKAARGVFATRP